ncbi:LysR family transcriptional regulator [Skermania piniformis]|uniref:LysR family transcriptional regulator n=1 Tax=Skermania pinensis TaxID=39122 RepID=A0ABX8S912_9ACTN|nr:LysR family transcriptional regulator [Skermania piniformis]QXQ13647.1 LysR family transcriptional regulator [Skermania piniformis]
MDVHLRDLRYFVAVAEELHFTNAAQRLEVAQPTLSRQIRQLEKQLDTVLFDRDQRSVALTRAGRELLVGARKVLADWDQTDEGLRRTDRVLQIGIHPAGEHGLLPRFEEESGVRLVPYAASGIDRTSGLADHRADLALVWLPLPDPDRYRWIVLQSQQQWVLLAEGHRLAAAEEIDAGDLEKLSQVGGERTEDQLEELTRGHGILLLPRDSVALYRWPGVAARPVSGLPPTELALAWRADDDRELVRAVVDAATAAPDDQTPRARSS